MSMKSNRFEKFVSFQKRNEDERLVSGIASRETLDDQGDIVSIKAIEEALPDYMRWANIREMHGKNVAGKALSANIEGDSLRLDAQIIDDSAWNKVKNDVYKGFSIGGEVVSAEQRIRKDGTSYRYITALTLNEISLVDRPANPEAVFTMWKGANMASPLDQEIEDLTERITARNDALAKASEPVEEEEAEEEETGELTGELEEGDEDLEAEDESESEDEETEEEEEDDSEDEDEELEDEEESEADEEEDDEAEETDDSDEDESEEDLEDSDEDQEEDEDSEEEEDEDEDEPEETDKASRGGTLSKAGSKAKPASSKSGDSDEDEDPDGDGDNDEMSTPAFILSVLQAMRSSAEHSGDLDSARALGQACGALAAHRVNDPAEATPGAPGHEPNKAGGTSVPKGKEGQAGGSANFYMAQSISDLIKASYGGTNAGTGGKGVNLIKPTKTNPANVGGKGKKPKGSAVTSAASVGRKSPTAAGFHNAKSPAKSKPGGTFTQGSNKAAGAGDDLQKAYFEGLTKTLETLTARLEKVEGQPTDNGPMLRANGTAADKTLGTGSIKKGSNGKIDKVAMLQELAAQELDPQLKYQLGELAAKAELRGMYNFQN